MYDGLLLLPFIQPPDRTPGLYTIYYQLNTRFPVSSPLRIYVVVFYIHEVSLI